MGDFEKLLYGEFLKETPKRILIILTLLVGLVNYFNFSFLAFLDFTKTYFIFNIGITWVVLSVWILIWFIAYPFTRRGF